MDKTDQSIATMPAIIRPLQPPIYQNYPVDTMLRIYHKDTFYEAEVFREGQMVRIPISLTSSDLADLNEQLQKAMAAVALDNSESATKSEAESASRMWQLAQAGHYAFARIFSNPQARKAIETVFGRTDSTIQVVSEDFFIAWDALYTSDLDQPIKPENFVGLNHIVSQTIVQDGGVIVSPVLSCQNQPILGLLINDQLPAVLSKELPFFEKLVSEGKITLQQLRALDPAKLDQDIREVKRFCGQTMNITHFACHAMTDLNSHERSRLVLSSDFPVMLMDIDNYDISVSGYPLVVLNACRTAQLSALRTSFFASTFLRHGALGVLATECAIPDDFAADFAQEIYGGLLSGETLGNSLLAARRHCQQLHRNLTGLFYALYAPPSIRFHIALGG